MFDFRILRLEFENIIVIFEISILEFLLSLCLIQKKKIPKFGKKLPIRGYFWKGIWK